MTIDKAYNSWADNYDAVENKTRDLEKIAAKQTLDRYNYSTVVELGCGTGKNTVWLVEKANSIIGLDFSSEMLLKAKEKIRSNKVQFQQVDLTKPWNIEDNYADLISCSLVLEHIYDLNFIFSEGFKKLKSKGIFYICELHPFKQYSGSKARFENENGIVELEVFTHHVSEYVNATTNNGFKILELKEWFDNDDKTEIPRLISFIFEKQ
ncbi:MAG: SAM-dependent methyltransferase [Bacteroidetes bacterium]|nr:class I SAM-dependent methyltransferase [Bacteroidia bacterium]PCH66466.1 MAG: SAM-dependent methyltransferase [Bacteroidota bacterium]